MKLNFIALIPSLYRFLHSQSTGFIILLFGFFLIYHVKSFPVSCWQRPLTIICVSAVFFFFSSNFFLAWDFILLISMTIGLSVSQYFFWRLRIHKKSQIFIYFWYFILNRFPQYRLQSNFQLQLWQCFDREKIIFLSSFFRDLIFSFSNLKVRVTKHYFFPSFDSRKIFFRFHVTNKMISKREQKICSRTVSGYATYRVKL